MLAASARSLLNRVGASSKTTVMLPPAAAAEAVLAPHQPASSSLALLNQVRWKNPTNSESLFQQYYNNLKIRKKWKRAIRKGTFIWCEKTGQVRIPTVGMSGYDEKKNPFKGRFENCRSPRVWLKD
eukprot:TRINITY_DN70736_c0_g1_i1.p1 TRINITY_DN70736_c0_g1~~TRINITY_DN70736_c0_g1_i1.p1  ORF type:complete len:126 (-),score=18.86 TRINITY_DN70736_c0_g1_i1:47-424(-)